MKIILQSEARNLSHREVAINYHDLINLLSKIGLIKKPNPKLKPTQPRTNFN